MFEKLVIGSVVIVGTFAGVHFLGWVGLIIPIIFIIKAIKDIDKTHKEKLKKELENPLFENKDN